jgi:hypothetical protein
MRRLRLLLGVGAVPLLVVAGFGLLLWITRPTPGVTWENFHRLRCGMSERDVKRLLGEPDKVGWLRRKSQRRPVQGGLTNDVITGMPAIKSPTLPLCNTLRIMK